MKSALTVYTFNANAKTINFSGVPGFDIKRLIAITHLPTGKDLYSLDGYASFIGTTLTLAPSVDTSGMANGDPFTILYEFPEGATEATAVDILDKLSADPSTGANQDEQTVILNALATLLSGVIAISAQSLPLPSGASTETTLAAVLAKLNQSISVTGFPVTQAVSAASLPLPTGAATQQTLADVLAKIIANPATETTLASILSKLNASIAITAATLPLPTGASSETTLSALNTKIPTLGQKTAANSQPVVLASDQSRVNVSTEERPTSSAASITPSDTVNIGTPTRGIYVGVGGSVVAVINGVAITFANVPAGMILPIVATRVNATGTSATSLVALS